MESIIAAIIAGLFSLAGIWYQNYLSKRPAKEPDDSPRRVANIPGNAEVQPALQTDSKPNYKSIFRIGFTILIVTIPWASFDYLLRLVDKQTFIKGATRHNLVVVRNEIGFYCAVWLIITVAALMTGWTRKTIFEKIILIASTIFFIFIGIVRFMQYDRLL